MKNKKSEIEMRYYDVATEEYILALYGDSWKRKYEYILHIHNLMEIGICLSGKGNFWFEEKKYPYKKDIITIIPANFIHTTESDDRVVSHWEYIFLDVEKLLTYFYPDDILLRQTLLEQVNKTAVFIHKEDNEALFSVVKLILEEVSLKKMMYKECLKKLCYIFIMQIARIHENPLKKLDSSENFHQIKKALSFIQSNYNQPIKIVEIAKTCHMSESHFRRTFEANLSMTPVEYLNTYRITKACELIREKQNSMEEIAQKTGFSSISAFNRNFKHMFGVSPRTWKKNPDNYERNLERFNVLVKKGW